MSNIFIASDHAGYKLKEAIINGLVIKGVKYKDLGPENEQSVDYPDFAEEVCKMVRNEEGLGILICGTGLGMSMAANKMPGIRAALCFNTTMAKYAKAHNDANVLCLGARILGIEVAKDIVDTFLNTEFEFGRHKRRIEKIMAIQEGKKDPISQIEKLHDDISNIASRIEEMEDGMEDNQY